MPQAKQGGNGVRAFAVAGSKFDGTGFENEHIGHTHVALMDGAAAGAGLARLSGVESALAIAEEAPLESCLDGFG